MVFSAAGSLAQYREPFYQNPGHGRSGVVQDIIDIHLVENELIGIVEGRREYRLDLDLGEKIVWRAARGEVGAVLTDSRALALSGASRGWAELSLKLQEADRVAFIKPFISDYLVMLVTGRRIIGFDSGKRRWVQQSIPIREKVTGSHINSYVAAVITSKRVFAWGRGRIGFTEEKLRSSETVQYVETQPHTVTVGTDARVLVFKSGSGRWREF
jgi:hypothetical protein